MAHDGDERVRDWSRRQRRSQRPHNELLVGSARVRTSHNLAATITARTLHSRIVRRPVANRENQDLQMPDSKSRVDRNGQDISRKSEPRPRDTTDRYKIEYRKPQHCRQMIVSDSSDSDSPRLIVSDSSDSDSPRSELLPRWRLRKSTIEAQLEEPQPKHSLRNLSRSQL
jgi:hypothetical protein